MSRQPVLFTSGHVHGMRIHVNWACKKPLLSSEINWLAEDGSRLVSHICSSNWPKEREVTGKERKGYIAVPAYEGSLAEA
eukprot:1154173-Pelagomonas_calceolata.AAC.1